MNLVKSYHGHQITRKLILLLLPLDAQADERGSSGRTQSDIVPRPLVRRGILDPRDATVSSFLTLLSFRLIGQIRSYRSLLIS